MMLRGSNLSTQSKWPRSSRSCSKYAHLKVYNVNKNNRCSKLVWQRIIDNKGHRDAKDVGLRVGDRHDV